MTKLNGQLLSLVIGWVKPELVGLICHALITLVMYAHYILICTHIARGQTMQELKTERLFVRVKPSLKKEVIDAAQRHDLTLSEWVEQAIKKALKNEST